jgi:hypothetical protein
MHLNITKHANIRERNLRIGDKRICSCTEV